MHFQRMLNNAIDHSKAKTTEIRVAVEKGSLQFLIRDRGLGVFANVRKYYKLSDEFVAAEHVYKGKQTTAPKNHSGQGIFFTSRIADQFVLRSHRIETLIDNLKKDVFYGDTKFIKGTGCAVFRSRRDQRNRFLSSSRGSPTTISNLI